MSNPLHIDSSGRIVIPKAIREACGIDHMTPLELRREGRELRLIPQETVPEKSVLDNGWVIVSTGSAHDTDIHSVIHEEYENRLHRFDR